MDRFRYQLCPIWCWLSVNEAVSRQFWLGPSFSSPVICCTTPEVTTFRVPCDCYVQFIAALLQVLFEPITMHSSLQQSVRPSQKAGACSQGSRASRPLRVRVSAAAHVAGIRQEAVERGGNHHLCIRTARWVRHSWQSSLREAPDELLTFLRNHCRFMHALDPQHSQISLQDSSYPNQLLLPLLLHQPPP